MLNNELKLDQKLLDSSNQNQNVLINKVEILKSVKEYLEIQSVVEGQQCECTRSVNRDISDVHKTMIENNINSRIIHWISNRNLEIKGFL